MPRLFQHRNDLANRPGAIELNSGDDAFADAMIEVFEKDKSSSFPVHRKRIGVEAMIWIGNSLPARAAEIPGPPNARTVGVAPTDVPVRCITAEAIYVLCD